MCYCTTTKNSFTDVYLPSSASQTMKTKNPVGLVLTLNLRGLTAVGSKNKLWKGHEEQRKLSTDYSPLL